MLTNLKNDYSFFLNYTNQEVCDNIHFISGEKEKSLKKKIPYFLIWWGWCKPKKEKIEI